ncbi:DUF418 domain-containing protein [Allosalinactinospora lopnorensis]|uniref:DUF418 domain-containing protein n=1 Tax=Allosalinactinospora lopnorensis TaxID=1352348 RepID=UPI000623BF9E|nr:DUF418 domain-containing protein [Allosalinactinospora lopnorensis]
MTGSRPRIEELDVLRGFALCGILLVNVQPITGMGFAAPPPAAAGPPHMTEAALSMLAEGRFIPVFAFLFGAGFAMFLESPAERHPRPRLPLVRRLVALAVIGALHSLLYPGEVLLSYAVFGLVILLPASYLPRRLVLGAGLVWSAAAVTLVHGGAALTPGLFLLGSATARYRVPHTLPERTRQVAAVFVLLLASSVPAMVWHFQEIERTGFASSGAVAGLLMAAVHTAGICLLMRTPLSRFLRKLFTPMGRMALTNYLSATVAVLLTGALLGLKDRPVDWTILGALAACVLLVQWVLSTCWLRRFRYGPVEWVWRCVTWWSVVPIAIPPDQRGSGGVPRKLSGAGF